MYIPGWPGIFYVNQAGHIDGDPPASTSQELGLKLRPTTLGQISVKDISITIKIACYK